MTHLDIQNTSYCQKKGHELNWQFDYWPRKVRNHLNFLVCRWQATYCWKALNEGYNFALDLTSIGGLHTELWAPKLVRVSTLRILGLPLESLEKKWHLGASPVARHKIYYKGEGDGFPQVQAMVNLMSLCSPVVLSPHPEALTCPSTPKVLNWTMTLERTQIHSPSIVFTFGLTVKSIKELGGASIKMY